MYSCSNVAKQLYTLFLIGTTKNIFELKFFFGFYQFSLRKVLCYNIYYKDTSNLKYLAKYWQTAVHFFLRLQYTSLLLYNYQTI